MKLRASIATYNRVTFPHPHSGMLMLALERKATAWHGDEERVRVQAQPFGGAVRILNPLPLQTLLGDLEYDTEHSRTEQDFRILIHPSRWEALKQYALQHLAQPTDPHLESNPHRELSEELDEALDIRLDPAQYIVRPLGFVVEDNPVPTTNADVHGQLTVRLYRIFDVRILDRALCEAMLGASGRYSDRELAERARQDLRQGGRGRANSILTVPLQQVVEAYEALEPGVRYTKIPMGEYELGESVLAILPEVQVPQYRRL